MNFIVEKKFKKEVQKELKKQSKGIYYLWIFEKIVLFASIGYIIIFPIYCLITGANIYPRGREGNISYGDVYTSTIVGGACALSSWLFISIFRKRLEAAKIGGRILETLEIKENLMFYTFRIQYQTLQNQKNLVIVDLNSIDNLNYNEKKHEIEIEGKMLEKIVDISKDAYKVKISEMEKCKIQIFDYFTPSLYEKLKNK